MSSWWHNLKQEFLDVTGLPNHGELNKLRREQGDRLVTDVTQDRLTRTRTITVKLNGKIVIKATDCFRGLGKFTMIKYTGLNYCWARGVAKAVNAEYLNNRSDGSRGESDQGF